MAKTSIGYGSQKEIIFNGSKYCVLTAHEGTAGTEYMTYNYVVQKGDKHLTLEFTLTFPSCGAQDEMEKCDEEQKTFDPINMIDQILSTFRFIK